MARVLPERDESPAGVSVSGDSGHRCRRTNAPATCAPAVGTARTRDTMAAANRSRRPCRDHRFEAPIQDHRDPDSRRSPSRTGRLDERGGQSGSRSRRPRRECERGGRPRRSLGAMARRPGACARTLASQRPAGGGERGERRSRQAQGRRYRNREAHARRSAGALGYQRAMGRVPEACCHGPQLHVSPAPARRSIRAATTGSRGSVNGRWRWRGVRSSRQGATASPTHPDRLERWRRERPGRLRRLAQAAGGGAPERVGHRIKNEEVGCIKSPFPTTGPVV